MQYFNFEDIKGDERFKLGPHKALMRTLEDFYGATVRLVFNPMETRTAITLTSPLTPRRSCIGWMAYQTWFCW